MISKKGLLKFVKYTLIFMNAFGFILSIFLGLFGIAYPDKHFPLSYKGREMALCSLFCMLVTTIGYCGAHNHRRILLIVYGATNVIIVIIVIVLWLLFRENSILGNKEINNMFITTLAITIAVMFLFSFILAFHIQTFKTNINDSIVSQSHQLLLQTTALLQQQQQQQQQQHQNHHHSQQQHLQQHQLTSMSNNQNHTTTSMNQQSTLNDPPMGNSNNQHHHMQQLQHHNQAPQQTNQMTSHQPSNANYISTSDTMPRSHHHNNLTSQHPPPPPPLGTVMGRGIPPPHLQQQQHNPYDLGTGHSMGMLHGPPPAHMAGPPEMVSPTPFQVPPNAAAAIRHQQMMPPAPPPPTTAATIKMSSTNSSHGRTRSQTTSSGVSNCDQNNNHPSGQVEVTTPRSRGESSSQRVGKSQTSQIVGGQSHYSTSSGQKHPGSATLLHQTQSLRDPHQRQHSTSSRHHESAGPAPLRQQIAAPGGPQHQHQQQNQACPVQYCTFQCDGTV